MYTGYPVRNITGLFEYICMYILPVFDLFVWILLYLATVQYIVHNLSEG